MFGCAFHQLNIDLIAERIRVFHERPLSTYNEFLKESAIAADGTVPASDNVVKNLLADHVALLDLCVVAVDEAVEVHDMGTEELVKGFIIQLEKHHWMLSAFSEGQAVRHLPFLCAVSVERMQAGPIGHVTAVSRSATHTLSKPVVDVIRLLAGLGVEGDAHAGTTVKHRSRVRQDPAQPNLRQVHLIHAELHDELNAQRFELAPGQMGENITTRGIDLLSLPKGALLHIGPEAVVEVTGLRNPCAQLDGIRPGLMNAVLGRDAEGRLVRKAGIMGVVLRGGDVRPGDTLRAEPPLPPHEALDRV